MAEPAGIPRDQAFITDCLPTARASTGVATRLADWYAPVVAALDAPRPDLAPHPDEDAIVAEALAEHAERLRAQLRAAAPEIVISLGNAAARVLGRLADQSGRAAVLTPATYGQERQAQVAGRTLRRQALVHPAAPKLWRTGT